MNAVTHLEKVITGEVSAVTHLEKVITGETSAVTYTEKVITGEAPPITHLQKVIAGVENPVTHLEHVWAGSTPEPTEHEYTGAVPYTFTANGEPLLDWRISGNTVQSTTPTPQNPVMPNSCGERTGNLIFKTIFSANISPTGVIQTISGFNLIIAKVTQGQAYSGDGYVYAFFASEPAMGDASYNAERVVNSCKNVTAPLDGYLAIRVPDDAENLMINEGSTALPYEPYGVKIPILSNSTTTPVYLGEVETTRKIRQLVLTGEEEWQFFSDSIGSWQFYINNISLGGVPQSSCVSNIAPYGVTATTRQRYDYGCYLVMSGSSIAFQMKGAKDTFTGITAWKSYLAAQYAAGTPVTVWYVLATEETAVINEPLMKIGDYADEVSNVATIPTNNGSTTIDVDTTVKPSEIYIKYKGV